MAKDDKKQIDKQSSVKKSPSSSKGAGANNEQVDVPQPQANITFSGGIGGFLSNNADFTRIYVLPDWAAVSVGQRD